MSVSAAKRAANRLNAQKSTGPRTPEGKANSSRNAITHGIFCRNLLLASEEAGEMEALRVEAVNRFKPRDGIEGVLVEQYLCCAWRLKRLRRTEMKVYLDRSETIKKRLLLHYDPKPGDPMENLIASAEQILQELLYDESAVLEKLSRYEQRMFNSMLRCSKELRVLQKEEIDQPTDEEVNAQNEATDPSDANAQNEATAASATAKSNDPQP